MSYQRRLSSARGERLAGGRYHAVTLQWPEVLARIRESQIDLGSWGTWGVHRWFSFARIRDALNMRWRGPRKTDYQYNFAWPSQACDLMNGAWRQVPRLVDVMDESPERWREGVVIIRIGINDFGKLSLDRLAVDANDPTVRTVMDRCVDEISRAVEFLRRSHPDTRIVLVGIFDNSQDPNYHQLFQSAREISKIQRGLTHFDDALRSLSANTAKCAFFDDRAWFVRHWGKRDDGGRPAFKVVSIGNHLKVTNTCGDHPENAVLGNGHAGLIWNVLWVQALIETLRTAFALPIDPLDEAEIGKFIENQLLLMPNRP